MFKLYIKIHIFHSAKGIKLYIIVNLVLIKRTKKCASNLNLYMQFILLADIVVSKVISRIALYLFSVILLQLCVLFI